MEKPKIWNWVQGKTRQNAENKQTSGIPHFPNLFSKSCLEEIDRTELLLKDAADTDSKGIEVVPVFRFIRKQPIIDLLDKHKKRKKNDKAKF